MRAGKARTRAGRATEWLEFGERLRELNPRRFDIIIAKLRVLVQAEEAVADRARDPSVTVVRGTSLTKH